MFPICQSGARTRYGEYHDVELLQPHIRAGNHAFDFRVAAIRVFEEHIPGQQRAIGPNAHVHADNLIGLQAREARGCTNT